jgi:hypothetical protein
VPRSAAKPPFDGYTVPTEVTAGYDYDSPRWPGCTFIQRTINAATYC